MLVSIKVQPQSEAGAITFPTFALTEQSQLGHLRDFYTTALHKSTEAFSFGAGNKAALKTCCMNHCVSDPWVERKWACFQSEDIIFLVSSIKSLWKIWNPIIVTCLDEAKAMHIVRPQALMSWKWGCGETGRFASPTNYQAASAFRKVQRMFIAQFVHLVHAFTALWIAHTAFPGFGGQIQGKIWWQHIQIST